MKKVLFTLLAVIVACLTVTAQDAPHWSLGDQYKSVNETAEHVMTSSVTYALNINGFQEGDLLTVTRIHHMTTDGVTVDSVVNVITDNVYNPDEWYARYDALDFDYFNQIAMFNDTYYYPFGPYDRVAEYVIQLRRGDYLMQLNIIVDFSNDGDIVTSLNEILDINKETAVYDVYGRPVREIQPNMIYIKGGKKYVNR